MGEWLHYGNHIPQTCVAACARVLVCSSARPSQQTEAALWRRNRGSTLASSMVGAARRRGRLSSTRDREKRAFTTHHNNMATMYSLPFRPCNSPAPAPPHRQLVASPPCVTGLSRLHEPAHLLYGLTLGLHASLPCSRAGRACLPQRPLPSHSRAVRYFRVQGL